MTIACFMWGDILYVPWLMAWDEFVSACVTKLFAIKTEYPSILCWQPWASIILFLRELEFFHIITICRQYKILFYMCWDFHFFSPLFYMIHTANWNIELICAWSEKKRERNMEE